MNIAIANDHVAVELKKILAEHLMSKGHSVTDCGTNSGDRVDYPIYAKLVADEIKNGSCERGILICGSGVGMCIAANKFAGIRAVVCSEPYSAKLSREHNFTNILCMGARVIGIETAKMIADIWIEAEFEGGRHAERLDMIKNFENRDV
ncbi:MAG: ribose 5-phosphate isomerase B [Defluviitaleaceae bacterium]|nr:ribose 5-phosphate isomerase B [Defluviitaleaceae bacterium]